MTVIKSIMLLTVVCCFAAMAYSQHVGGLDAEKPADESLDKIMRQAMSKLQSSFPGGFEKIEPISYRTQMVSGMNYFVKVKVVDKKGGVKHAHVRLYRPFKSGVEVHGIRTDVTESSPLIYFQASQAALD